MMKIKEQLAFKRLVMFMSLILMFLLYCGNGISAEPKEAVESKEVEISDKLALLQERLSELQKEITAAGKAVEGVERHVINEISHNTQYAVDICIFTKKVLLAISLMDDENTLSFYRRGGKAIIEYARNRLEIELEGLRTYCDMLETDAASNLTFPVKNTLQSMKELLDELIAHVEGRLSIS